MKPSLQNMEDMNKREKLKQTQKEGLKSLANLNLSGGKNINQSYNNMETKTKPKKTNPWLVHVKKVKGLKQNQGKSLKEILQEAKKTYKKKEPTKA